MRALGTAGSLTILMALTALIGGCREEPSPFSTDGALADYEPPLDLDTAGLPGPVQPILYRHDIHAGQYEMDCRYCHFSAEVSFNPGLPTV
jgi:hypothetical protein